ncbi:MAG: ribosome-associated translation inhibitor RaiA [Bacteroidota bacterium]
MQLQVHSIHFDADVKLVNFIKDRISKLDLYYDNIISGEVFLRLDKSDVRDNKIAEIKINIPGKEIFAKKQCKSFEEATDTTIEAIRRQIQKFKGKSKLRLA